MTDYKSKYLKYKYKYLESKKNNMIGGQNENSQSITNKYEPNIELLNDHGTDGSYDRWKKKNNIRSPYCLSFNDNHKLLNYIGVTHTMDENSPTFKLVRKIIEEYKPELIMIEGVPISKGINPVLNNFQGEGEYASRIGKEYGSSFIGIETDESDLIEKLLKKFSKQNILGYDFLRQHKYYYRTMKVDKIQLLDDFKEYNIFGDKTFNPLKWYEKTFGKKFIYGKNLEYASPYNGKNAVITQIIGYNHSRNRDIANIKNLYEQINQFDNILFIMGENHVYANKDVLTATFGKPKIIM